MATTGARFQLRDVCVAYGSHLALRVPKLDIRAGEALALVGPSGAGKTTLLQALGAVLRPSSGRVWIDDTPLETLSGAQLRSVRADTGFIHQDLSLVPNLRVVQNVVSGKLGRVSLMGSFRLMLATPKQDVLQAHAILERVGIPEKLYERTDRLSGGQRQRVAIARALFQRPRALLADEPVSSVDPARARDTVALLAEISREHGLTLCASIHNLELAREFFPRLIGLREGRIAFDRPTQAVDADEFSELYRLDEAARPVDDT